MRKVSLLVLLNLRQLISISHDNSFFKKQSIRIIFSIWACIFSSCNKSNDSITNTTSGNGDTTIISKDTISPTANVYIAGDVSDGVHNFIKYWNNGKSFVVGDSLKNIIPSSIFVSGKDVYVSGAEYPAGNVYVPEYATAAYWKNGVITRLIDSSKNGIATDITVSGNDVYVLEQEIYDSLPNYRLYIVKYWKNGVPVNLCSIDGGAGASSIFVKGNDVYVAGHATYQRDGINYYTAAVYWKNGKMVYLTDGSKYSGAYSIYVSGNDVYVAGYDGNNATYWKNGVPVTLSNGPGKGWANSIAVIGNNVYAAGGYHYSNNVAKYWVNGIDQDLLTGWDKGLDTYATGISVAGSDVYICGYGPKSVYWKNGIVHQFSPQGDDHSVRATAIFVTQ